ncbi:hypothetical protein GQ607_007972 [Colletotrichum asianum]|uniref:Uncharacterized protein n=1 Tax=Colletotrichum asianum TaxID=702518 RepID=A0A8H3WFI2_9PEZI|nr:hypothetical protein GQ607_007972 [Colletotrichum asianum]
MRSTISNTWGPKKSVLKGRFQSGSVALAGSQGCLLERVHVNIVGYLDAPTAPLLKSRSGRTKCLQVIWYRKDQGAAEGWCAAYDVTNYVWPSLIQSKGQNVVLGCDAARLGVKVDHETASGQDHAYYVPLVLSFIASRKARSGHSGEFGYV